MAAASRLDSHAPPPLSLHQAIRDDVADVFASLLVSGIAQDMDAPDAYGDTPLQLATKLRSTEFVEMLLKAGAASNVPDSNMQTPLMAAASHGDVATLGVLLDGGANVLLRDATGRCALTLALEQGSIDAIDKLLAFGAELDADDGEDRSLRCAAAAMSRSVRLTNKLIQEGITAVGPPGRALGTALLTAEDQDMIAMLLSAGADINFVDEEGNNALAYATSATGTVAKVKFLVAAGIDVDRTNSSGFTPLHTASTLGYSAAVNVLLDSGANVNGTGGGMLPPLILALAGWIQQDTRESPESRQTLKALLAAGARVDTQVADDVGPLQLAVAMGDPDLVELLLAFDANPDETMLSGHTVLMNAAYEGHVRIVQLLLSAKANAHVKTKHGDTALHFACSRFGNKEVVTAFLAAGADPNAVGRESCTPLGEAVNCGDASIVQLLLNAGANANGTIEGGHSVLFKACVQDEVAILQHLLDGGADVNRVEEIAGAVAESAVVTSLSELDDLLEQGSGIFQAIRRGMPSPVIDAFSAVDRPHAGPNMHAADIPKTTALTALMVAVFQGHARCVAMLLAAGADPTLETNGGVTALSVAQEIGEHEIFAMLANFESA